MWLETGRFNFRLWLSTAQMIEAIGRGLCDPKADLRISELEWPFWVDSSPSWLSPNRSLFRCRRRATFGHKQSFSGTMSNVRFPIRKETFERFAAAQNNLLLGYVGFGISKRKQFVGADFVA